MKKGNITITYSCFEYDPMITDVSETEKELLKESLKSIFYNVRHRKIVVIKTLRALTFYKYGIKLSSRYAKELAEEFLTDDQYYGEQTDAED